MTTAFVAEYPNTKTAGARLGITERTVQRWLKAGQIEFVDGVLREIDLLTVDKQVRAKGGGTARPWERIAPPEPKDSPPVASSATDGFPVHPMLRERVGELPRLEFDTENMPLLRDRPEEYDRLQVMLMRVTVPCKDDDRFTTERSEISERAELSMLACCIDCPALDACDAYARAALPGAGYWAGEWYPQRKRETR